MWVSCMSSCGSSLQDDPHHRQPPPPPVTNIHKSKPVSSCRDGMRTECGCTGGSPSREPYQISNVSQANARTNGKVVAISTGNAVVPHAQKTRQITLALPYINRLIEEI